MTKITIIAATSVEMADIVLSTANRYPCVVSGVGSIATAIATIDAIERHKPQLIVQVGIAGAVDPTLNKGDVVRVASDYQADLGAWRAESDRFEPFESRLIESDFRTGILRDLRSVAARTVATACTPFVVDSSQIETMEGAAFMAAAQSRGVNFIQLRAISNYVGLPRNEWAVQEAISALSLFVTRFVEEYSLDCEEPA